MSASLQIGLTREAWGPRFWKILHTLAEQCGNQTSPILSNDEADAWITLLKTQQFVMPCTVCKEHYKEWKKTHRYDHLRSLLGTQRREFLRNWLWGCHSRVNTMNMKPDIDLKDVSSLYPKQSIQKEVEELNGMFQLAMTKQQLNYEDIKTWKTALQRIKMLSGV